MTLPKAGSFFNPQHVFKKEVLLKKTAKDPRSMDINDIGLTSEFRNFWNEGEAKGRSWGLKRDGKNPYFGSHFTFIDKDEVVLLVGGKKMETPLKIFQFKKTKNTIIGRKLLQILLAYGVPVETVAKS